MDVLPHFPLPASPQNLSQLLLPDTLMAGLLFSVEELIWGYALSKGTRLRSEKEPPDKQGLVAEGGEGGDPFVLFLLGNFSSFTTLSQARTEMKIQPAKAEPGGEEKPVEYQQHSQQFLLQWGEKRLRMERGLHRAGARGIRN